MFREESLWSPSAHYGESRAGILEGLSPYYTMRFLYFVQVIKANVNEMNMQRK